VLDAFAVDEEVSFLDDRLGEDRIAAFNNLAPKTELKQLDDDVGIKHQARKSLHLRPPRLRTSWPPSVAASWRASPMTPP